jgi:hypothetical protein
VKLLLDRGARRYLAGATAGALLVTGCSSGQSLPSVGGEPGPAQSARMSASLMVKGSAPEGFVNDACTDPGKFKVCLSPGGSVQLGIKLTCHRGTRVIHCGHVSWSTTMSHAGLAGSFKPNPGNPTNETVTAAKSVKLGHYYQKITAKCTAFPNCGITGKGAVWVI